MSKTLYEVTAEVTFYVYADKPPTERDRWVRMAIDDSVRDGVYSVDARPTKTNILGEELEIGVFTDDNSYVTLGEALAAVNEKS